VQSPSAPRRRSRRISPSNAGSLGDAWSRPGCRQSVVSDDEVWRDDPVRSVAEDQLGRGHVARRVADLLVGAHSWDSSLVFSLTGPWGSGKSSLLEMVSEIVGTEHENWSIARFTPWASSDVDGLLGEFYSSLSSALPPDRGKEARNALAVCAQVVGPVLKMVPIAGDVLAQGAQLAADALSRRTPWQQAFDASAHALREAGRPVLVLVDDLDRLQRDELLVVLKVVRLLGRFPGVNYLLAYDEQTLFATLREHQSEIHGRERSRRFMEKIVQYPVVVPPMLPSQIITRLGEGLARVTDDMGRPLASGEDRLSQLRDVFEHQLTTPRAIDRFLAQVRLDLSHHEPDEIDDVDLILLAFVRIQFPDLYAALPRWRGRLTRTLSAWHWAAGRDKETDWTKLFELAGDDESEMDARDVFEVLFPATSKHGAATARRGVSNPEYFSRYFVHTVPEDDVADALIAEALLEAGEKGERQTLIRKLVTSTYPGKADLALSKLLRASIPDSTRSQPNSPTSLPLLSAVMSVLTQLDGGTNSLFRHQERGISWAANIIEQLPRETDPEALAASLRCCDDLMLRLHVIWSTKRDRIASTEAVEAVARTLAAEALEAFLENLRQRTTQSRARRLSFR
jgi:predicted KAP-like P-loop ATPase